MQIIHEIAGRIRLRPQAGPERLARAAAAMPDLEGVIGVRANPVCDALVIRYRGGPEIRAKILALAADPPAISVPAPLARNEGFNLLLAAGVLIASLVLPRPLLSTLTLVNITPTILRGLNAAVMHGLKAEVLDALAVTFPTLRGEYITTNFTRFLVQLAEFIESTTAERSDELLRSLLRQQPQDVWLLGSDGEMKQVPFSSLKGGESVVVGTGQTIPIDGEVISGDAYIDQSAVTGESLPLPRAAGNMALAGGIITAGKLVIRADRVGAATTTGRITRYIQEALEKPATIQSISEQFADRRVGLTLASAAAVFAITRDWRRLESVFMVDYSCTVKLGTPLALKSAMYQAAREGVLIKSGQTLESLDNVDTVVFDKTGTLTHNTLQVTDICPLSSDIDEKEAIAIVASLGEHTTHPIAGAIVNLAHQRHLAHIPHEEVNFIVGHGVQGNVEGDLITFGSRHFLEDDEKVSFAAQRSLVSTFQAEGKSLLYAARNGRPLAVFALRDRLRDECQLTLEQLRRHGIKRLVMITGDQREKALAFGHMLGMDDIFYEQQPEDKAQIIEKLKSSGSRVAYIGDGVNDGPALMVADVGISMPRAADIARATADIVLIDDRLDSLAQLFGIARETMKLIRSGFKIAVSANTAILGGAAGGYLSPRITAALHNGTTIAVLLRSLMASK